MPASSARRRKVISPHCAAHFGPAQCVDQRARFLLQGLLAERDGFERGLQAAESFGAVFFNALDLLLGLAQRLADRCEHGLDRFLAFAERRDRVLLMLSEVLARELQEQLAVRAQR